MNMADVKTKLKAQRIETPSWGYADSGTRFGVFPQAGAAVTIFAAAQDANNWLGFRIVGGKLYCETRVDGRVSAKVAAYDAERHRWLRLRPGTVAAVVVWETSADGRNWVPEFVATPEISVSSLRVALSAGTLKAVPVPGSAAFDNFLVEKP